MILPERLAEMRSQQHAVLGAVQGSTCPPLLQLSCSKGTAWCNSGVWTLFAVLSSLVHDPHPSAFMCEAPSHVLLAAVHCCSCSCNISVLCRPCVAHSTMPSCLATMCWVNRVARMLSELLGTAEPTFDNRVVHLGSAAVPALACTARCCSQHGSRLPSTI